MTVEELLGIVGLMPSSPMAWADCCPERVPGVEVVTCAEDLEAFDRGNHRGGVRMLHVPADARRVWRSVLLCYPKHSEKDWPPGFSFKLGHYPRAG